MIIPIVGSRDIVLTSFLGLSPRLLLLQMACDSIDKHGFVNAGNTAFSLISATTGQPHTTTARGHREEPWCTSQEHTAYTQAMYTMAIITQTILRCLGMTST